MHGIGNQKVMPDKFKLTFRDYVLHCKLFKRHHLYHLYSGIPILFFFFFFVVVGYNVAMSVTKKSLKKQKKNCFGPNNFVVIFFQ